MAVPAELRTERLLLRQWRPEDAEPLCAIYQEDEYLEHMPPMDMTKTRDQIGRFATEWSEVGFSHWAAEEEETGRLAGRVGLIRHFDWPESAPPVEVGWTLGREFTGHGYATEAGRASMECWRSELRDDSQLICITTAANVRSRAVAERLGLELRGATHWHGHDVIWYAVER